MSETLQLVCGAGNKRPSKTIQMREEAATKLVDSMIKSGHIDKADRDGSIDDVAKATRHETDGYKIARELESRHHWDCDMVIAEEMETFSGILDEIYESAEDLWAAENPREPAFSADESVMWRGKTAVVAGVDEYRPQRYRLWADEIPVGSTSAYIALFEDVTSAKGAE